MEPFFFQLLKSKVGQNLKFVVIATTLEITTDISYWDWQTHLKYNRQERHNDSQNADNKIREIPETNCNKEYRTATT